MNTSLKPEFNKSLPHKVFLYHKANFENPKADILKSNLSEENGAPETISTRELWNAFKTLIRDLIDKHIPSKVVRGRKDHKQWITHKVKRILRKEKKARSSGNTRHIQKYT